MHLDVFRSDAFSLTKMTAAINQIPFYPTLIGRLGLFAENPITTTSVSVEVQGETLALVADKPRGAPGAPVTLDRRKVRNFNARHLPQTVSVMADEVQNLRAFGSDSDEQTAMGLLTRKMAIARRRLDLTLEWQRIGAIKGQVLDADGSTVLCDLFTEFGIAQQTVDMALDVDATKVITKLLDAKRKSEDELGGVSNAGWLGLCSSTFFDAFTGHPAVASSFAYFNTSGFNRADNRTGFTWGSDVQWVEYRGKIGAIPFIEANTAYLVPLGVPDLFQANYAPAPYLETVNTPGLPFYAQQEIMDFNKGVDVECQSNPLMLNTRPRSIIKLTI